MYRPIAKLLSILVFLFIALFINIEISYGQKLDNPLLESLVNGAGLLVEPGENYKLPPPAMRDALSSAAEKKAIESAAGQNSLEQFTKDSVVAPQVLNIKSIGKLSTGGEVQQVDLLFIAYGDLKKIEDKNLFQGLAADEKANAENEGNAEKVGGPKEEGRELSDKELKERDLKSGEQPDGSKISYSLMRVNVLDKVLLTGIVYSCSTQSKDSVVVAMKMDERFTDDKVHPGQWQPLVNRQPGKAHPYSALAGYAKATELKTIKGALLVEVHVVFAEPTDWFGGRNLLRSKLPPVAQDSVRKFRRKLKQ